MDYSSEVQQRFLSPRGAGEFAKGTPGLVSGEADDRTLNVWVRFQVQVLEGVIHSARFQVYGCPYTVAAADWVAEWLAARPCDALQELDMHAVRKALDIPVERLGKLLLIEDAARACGRALEHVRSGAGRHENRR